MTPRQSGALGLAVAATFSGLTACGSALESSSLQQTSDPTPSNSIASTGPATTPANLHGPRLTWSDHEFEGQVYALAVDGAQFVAVGATGQGPTAWTSADAQEWEPHPVPQPPFLDQYLNDQGQRGDPILYVNVAGMGPLARLDETLFSFGTFGGDNDFFRPLGWRSSDGARWEFIESDNRFFDECCSTVHLVAGDPGLLALKHNFGEYSGELWLWTAQTSWVQTWAADTGASDNIRGAEFRHAIWASGRFVAVGLAATYIPGAPTWETAASSWVSTDGRLWQAAPQSADRDGSVMQAVAPRPDGGFVAVGCEQCAIDGSGTPAAWISPDGLDWSPVTLPATFEGTAYHVLPIDGGLLAVGTAPDGTATWTSVDGISWEVGQRLSTASDGPRVSFLGQRHNVAARGAEVVFILSRGRDELGGLLGSVLWRGAAQP